MSELSELYQEVILDHNKRPRNYGVLDDANRSADGYNPLCGDKLKLFLKVEDDRVAAVSFQGSGCAISKASASLMTDAIKGRSIQEVGDLFARVHAMMGRQMRFFVRSLWYSSRRAGRISRNRRASSTQPSGRSSYIPPMRTALVVKRAPQYASNRSRICSRSRKQ